MADAAAFPSLRPARLRRPSGRASGPVLTGPALTDPPLAGPALAGPAPGGRDLPRQDFPGSPPIAGLVLAGGGARRLGGIDKPLLRVGDTTMLAHVLAALDLPRVAISANGDPARFGAQDCPVLDDGAFPGQGPLAGILAGLDWAFAIGAETVLSVPGDTPFIPRGLARHLSPAPACAAEEGGRAHTLIALWPVTARQALRALLSRPGPRDVQGFAAVIGMRRVDFAPAAWDRFLNVNTPEDLARARALVGRMPAGDVGRMPAGDVGRMPAGDVGRMPAETTRREPIPEHEAGSDMGERE